MLPEFGPHGHARLFTMKNIYGKYTSYSIANDRHQGTNFLGHPCYLYE